MLNQIKYSLTFLFLIISLTACVCHAESMREWTSKEGKTISATLIELNQKGVKLELANGKKIRVPFSKLSQPDIDYAKENGLALLSEWEGWPNEIRMNLDEVKIKVDTERSQDGITYYVTEHFELKSEVELGSNLMLDVGRIFELTYRLIEASPWGIMATPNDGLFKAELYKTRQAYIAAGAPEWSGGVYLGRRKVFMVPIESLGIKKTTRGYRRNENFSLDTVVHEITHMLMADSLACLPIAVTEGIAEYISHIPLRQGAFRPKSVLENIRKRGHRKETLAFQILLNMTSTQWSSDKPKNNKPTSKFPPIQPADPHGKSGQYRSSLLLAYHLMHGLDNGSPRRLRALVLRAHKKATKRQQLFEQYEKEFAVYSAEIEKFMELPNVTKTEDGFTYPANLTPPKAPTLPFKIESEIERELGDLDIIYAGQTPHAFISNMEKKLQSAKIYKN